MSEQRAPYRAATRRLREPEPSAEEALAVLADLLVIGDRLSAEEYLVTATKPGRRGFYTGRGRTFGEALRDVAGQVDAVGRA